MERLIPGIFVSEFELEPIEVTKKISKEFTDGVYKFMLGRGEMLNVTSYFEEKKYYQAKGCSFDEDLIEIFVERHRAWIEK
jgi:hypothetical protein